MQLTIPDSENNTIQGDPAFADLRRHYSAFKAGVAVMLGAGVAIGAEAARLRAEIKPTKGPTPKKGNTVALLPESPWRDLVSTHAGVSYEHARRAEKVAIDLRASLQGKRDKDSIAARKLLDNPAAIQSFDDYATLSRVAGRTYDSDTWSGILVEIGVVRPHITQIAAKNGRGEHGGEQLPLFEIAVATARGFLGNLREAVAHHEQWMQRLAALPLDPTGDDDTPSLAELRAEINDRLSEVDSIIIRKKAAN